MRIGSATTAAGGPGLEGAAAAGTWTTVLRRVTFPEERGLTGESALLRRDDLEAGSAPAVADFGARGLRVPGLRAARGSVFDPALVSESGVGLAGRAGCDTAAFFLEAGLFGFITRVSLKNPEVASSWRAA